MVQPPTGPRVEPRGHLTGDPADLLGRQRTLGEHVGEGAGAGAVLLDDPGPPLVLADVVDAHEARVVDDRAAASGVEHVGGAGGVVPRDEQERDVAVEGRVVADPAGAALARGEGSTQLVASGDEGARANPVHVQLLGVDDMRSAPAGLAGRRSQAAILGAGP